MFGLKLIFPNTANKQIIQQRHHHGGSVHVTSTTKTTIADKLIISGAKRRLTSEKQIIKRMISMTTCGKVS